MEKRQQALESRLGEINKLVEVVYQNQVELAKSEHRLDEQFAVLTRMVYTKLNHLIHALNRNLLIGVNEDIAPVEYDETNKMFLEWHEFKNRSDWRDHSRVWFMGGDLSKLPPAPEPEEKPEPEAKEETPEGAPEDIPEGAQVFGGDYAESVERDETDEEERPEDGKAGEEVEVPGVPYNDQAPHQ